MNKKLAATIDALLHVEIAKERIDVLGALIAYIKDKNSNDSPINLNFICTHNSRRSQMAQAWAYAAGRHFGVPVNSFSGGVEVTAFNSSAIHAIQKAGFHIKKQEGINPTVNVSCDEQSSLSMFSKLYDDKANPDGDFAAIMTCSHADENCPIVLGAENRISVTYEDPKLFDDTPQEKEMYQERCLQIGAEIFYVFREAMK